MQTCSKCEEEKPLDAFYRYTASGKPHAACKICTMKNVKAWQDKNRDKVRGYVRESCKKAYARDPQKDLERKRLWRKDNPERAKAIWSRDNRKRQHNWTPEQREAARLIVAKFRDANRDLCAARSKQSRKKNLAHYAARASEGRAIKFRATPAWLTPIQMAQIHAMYEVAAMCSVQTGIKHHVDHIIPLNGKTVTGLHVPWNLRVIPAQENISKSNRILEEFCV
jgi:hypothetical protein